MAPGGFDQGRREVYEAEPVALISGDRRRLGGDQRARHPGRGSRPRLAKCRHRPGSWATPRRAVGLGPSGVSLSPFLLRVDTSTDWLVVVRDGNEPDLRFQPEITLLYLVWKHFFLFS